METSDSKPQSVSNKMYSTEKRADVCMSDTFCKKELAARNCATEQEDEILHTIERISQARYGHFVGRGWKELGN